MRGPLAVGAMIFAVAPVQALASDEDFRSYLDQARFFLRKEWYADAREQLEKAVSTQDGKLDPEAWFLLATRCGFTALAAQLVLQCCRPAWYCNVS